MRTHPRAPSCQPLLGTVLRLRRCHCRAWVRGDAITRARTCVCGFARAAGTLSDAQAEVPCAGAFASCSEGFGGRLVDAWAATLAEEVVR